LRALISSTTYEALVNVLGCNKPWMMRELNDLMTSHTSSQEAIWANFGEDKGKAWAQPIDEVNSEFVIAVDRVH